MNIPTEKNENKKKSAKSRYAVLGKVQEKLDLMAAHRVGKDYAMNYDPAFIQGFEDLVEFADSRDFSHVPDANLIDVVYGFMIVAHANQQVLPMHDRMTNWFDKVAGLVSPDYVNTYKLMAAQDTFNPVGVEKASYETYINVPPSPVYECPSVDPRIIEALGRLEVTHPEFNMSPLSGFSQTYDGVDTRFVTAQDPMAVLQATEKFNNYTGEYDGVDYNDLHLSAMLIVESMLEDFDSDMVDIARDISVVTEAVDKDASMGYTNVSFFRCCW